MMMKHLFSMKFALVAAVCAGGVLAALTVPAQAADKDYQWEVNIHRTTPDGKTHDATTYICMGHDQFLKPSKRLTGPRCPDQVFSLSDDALIWTAACDAAKGQGTWNFSHGGKNFEGQSVIDTPDGRTTTKVEGEVFGHCDI